MFRLINLVAIALFIIMGIILFKFNLVCEVSIAGKTVGYVADKTEFEQKVDNILNKEEEAKLFTTIENMPEYKLKLADKSEKTNEDIILAKLEDEAVTTYKLYAVTVDGKERTVLASLEEAEKIGCKTINGLGMMLYQGAASFKLWTDQDMPIDVVKEALDF